MNKVSDVLAERFSQNPLDNYPSMTLPRLFESKNYARQ